jgi:23S rRNA (cytidine1920-2'-O)/16S rRNA (cytidine1409-2'-O)-methyltransferase
LLKRGGRALQVVKLGQAGSIEPIVKTLEDAGLKVLKIIRPEKMEAYIVLEK